eukprot:CAMPEP_0171609710 /NCGR_PEP_ID=MMETSP0990-20121206/9637_1 /TAXON_ID=483369 /ORGANISM="non described non described, Strain CCMP2098" /LENGTH=33 /DNA_ID= /DNA_START= /DNA_END= /DNA_ORIENTATION=
MNCSLVQPPEVAKSKPKLIIAAAATPKKSFDSV